MSTRLALALGILLASACADGDAPPTHLQAPPGAEKKADTKVLEKGAEVLQNLAAIRSFDHYLDGFHVMKDDPSHHMEAHHFCKGMNEELTQCVVFDGNTEASNLIGVEYIVSAELFATLPEEEKKRWHPHNYEILSGQLVMPGVPAVAEKAALKKKMNSYGKTWHIWDTGHVGAAPPHELPVGTALLAWSYSRDGEAPASMIAARDERMDIDTAEKRTERQEFVPLGRPQRGVDDLKDRLKGVAEPPPGVKSDGTPPPAPSSAPAEKPPASHAH